MSTHLDVTIEDDWLAVVRPKTPQDLYDLMRNSHPFWKGRFIFRGHLDSAWSVIPSAWRPDNAGRLSDSISAALQFLSMRPRISESPEHYDHYRDFADDDMLAAGQQLVVEFNLIHEFYKTADAIGLDVPAREIRLAGAAHGVPDPLSWRPTGSPTQH
jgi:hypothetical protein